MTEIIREQPHKVKTGRKKRNICLGIAAVLILASLGVILYILNMDRTVVYIPPEFEVNAQKGVPEPDESFLYGGTTTDYGFSFKMASNLYQQEDGSLYVYLTNMEENDVYMMINIVDNKTNESLYKSGVIKPGEYIDKLPKYTEFGNEMKEATIKIYAFEKEHWYSEGTIEINCEIQPW